MGAFIAYTPKGGGPKTLQFDAVTNVTHIQKATATEHKVEKGANISDHIRKELDEVSFDAIISNEPVQDMNDHGQSVSSEELNYEHAKRPFSFTPGGIIAGVSNLIDDVLGSAARSKVNVKRYSKGGNYVSEMHAELVKIQTTGQLCEIITEDRTYDGMALLSVELKKSPETGTAGTFALEWKKIQQVEVKIVTAPKPTEPRGNKPKAKGSQSATPAPEPKKSKSTLKEIAGSKE